MAIRWKKYEMYGPKKPGLLKRLFWYLRDKCMSMRGLYILSVVFLTVLADVFIYGKPCCCNGTENNPKGGISPDFSGK